MSCITSIVSKIQAECVSDSDYPMTLNVPTNVDGKVEYYLIENYNDKIINSRYNCGTIFGKYD